MTVGVTYYWSVTAFDGYGGEELADRLKPIGWQAEACVTERLPPAE